MLPDPFKVTIVDPCDKPKWIQPPGGLDGAVIEYQLLDHPVEFSYGEFIQNPSWCKTTYSYELRDSKAQVLLSSYDELTRTFTFEYNEYDLVPLDDDFNLESKDYDLKIIA